jgi:hypothetical protein
MSRSRFLWHGERATHRQTHAHRPLHFTYFADEYPSPSRSLIPPPTLARFAFPFPSSLACRLPKLQVHSLVCPAAVTLPSLNSATRAPTPDARCPQFRDRSPSHQERRAAPPQPTNPHPLPLAAPPGPAAFTPPPRSSSPHVRPPRTAPASEPAPALPHPHPHPPYPIQAV